MGILATLKKESGGEWPSLPDYLREARHRETGALAALAAALTAPPEEQKELAQAEEAEVVLLDLACDLRVPKGSRLAGARVLLEGGLSGPLLGQLFAGAGDLVTDPRLGASARKLVDGGLPAALQLGGEAQAVSLAAGTMARAIQAAASAVGLARAKELLATAPGGHAGAAAGLFALGQGELPPDQLEAWKKLLEETCAKNRAAPAAAKRMGMAPPWPPNLPDAFAPLVQEAEKKTAGVVAADAAKSPALLKKGPGLPTAPVPPPKSPRPEARGPTPPPPPAAAGKTVAPPIKRSPFRKSIGAVMEVPKTTLPPKPMEEVRARAMPGVEAPAPGRPRIEKEESPLEVKPSPLPLARLPSREVHEIRLDPRGRKIPRADRWDDNDFQWDEPDLPSSEMPPPMRAAIAQGPFTQRIRSLFDDRPEAVDRLCAAAEARYAVKGEEAVAKELSQELSRKPWQDKKAPQEQVARLQNIRGDERQPKAWREVAGLLLDRLEALRPEE